MTTISLPEETIRFAESEAQRKGFASVDAYVESVLREERLRLAREKLDALLLEALDSGPPKPMTREDWDAARAAKVFAASKPSGSSGETRGRPARYRQSPT